MSTPFSHGTSGGVPSRRGWQAAATVVGGVCWLVLPLVFTAERIIYSIDVLDFVDPAVLPALAVPLLIIGVWGFYERFAGSYSGAGRGGLWALGIGVLGLWPVGLLAVVRLYTGLAVGFGVGMGALYGAAVAVVVIELGTIGVGIDSWRTGTPSKWMGVWFPLALPISTLVNYWAAHLNEFVWMGNHYYAGLFGLAWIGVGYYLARDWRAPR